MKMVQLWPDMRVVSLDDRAVSYEMAVFGENGSGAVQWADSGLIGNEGYPIWVPQQWNRWTAGMPSL